MNEDVNMIYKSNLPADRVMPLDVTLKSQFERVFGADFSNVKIHIGHNADQVAREHGAYAVAIGTDIYFSNGQYSPETVGGIKLLAHELSHVVQYMNDRSVEYHEDIAELESEAHDIEELFDDLTLHDIDAPVMEETAASQVDQGAGASAAGLTKSVNYDEVMGAEVFVKKKNLPEITVVLDSSRTPSFSGMEMAELQETLKNEIIDYFYEKKSSVTTDEWEEFVVKFFKFLRQ